MGYYGIKRCFFDNNTNQTTKPLKTNTPVKPSGTNDHQQDQVDDPRKGNGNDVSTNPSVDNDGRKTGDDTRDSEVHDVRINAVIEKHENSFADMVSQAQDKLKPEEKTTAVEWKREAGKTSFGSKLHDSLTKRGPARAAPLLFRFHHGSNQFDIWSKLRTPDVQEDGTWQFKKTQHQWAPFAHGPIDERYAANELPNRYRLAPEKGKL